MNHTTHQMQITSLYNYFPAWSEQEIQQAFRQETKQRIVKLLQDKGNMTDREIANIMGYPDPNKVRPRRNELMKAGIVEEHEKRTCMVGEKLSIAWRLNKDKLWAYIRG